MVHVPVNPWDLIPWQAVRLWTRITTSRAWNAFILFVAPCARCNYGLGTRLHANRSAKHLSLTATHAPLSNGIITVTRSGSSLMSGTYSDHRRIQGARG